MEDLELVLRTSGLGLATVFISISVLTTLLLVWGKLGRKREKVTPVDPSPEASASPVVATTYTEKTPNSPPLVENGDKIEDSNVEELEIVAVATAAIAAFDLWSVHYNDLIPTSGNGGHQIVGNDIRFASWRLYGRQQLMQSQGNLLRNWKRR